MTDFNPGHNLFNFIQHLIKRFSTPIGQRMKFISVNPVTKARVSDSTLGPTPEDLCHKKYLVD